MEKIIVAFESEKTALRVKELLEGGGAAACLVCRTADQVRRRRRASPCPDGGTTAWACSSCLGTV